MWGGGEREARAHHESDEEWVGRCCAYIYGFGDIERPGFRQERGVYRDRSKEPRQEHER